MASREVTTMVDDVDGSVAVETVHFALDGVDYDIDLSRKNAAALRRCVATWATAGRVVGGADSGGVPVAARVLEPVGDSRNALIRSWAVRQGFSVPARGRIPQEVRRQYDAAH